MFRHISKTLIFQCSKRCAGHSKWQNIKHIKASKDAQRSALFVNLCRRIKLAVHEGGSSNPKLNPQLFQAVEVARKKNMPSSSIESCIKQAETSKAGAKSTWFEIKGPGGSFIIASVFTENQKLTRETISPILRKNHAIFADNACKHMFEHKGEIIAKPPSGLSKPEEAVVDHAIECGAEEVIPHNEEDGTFKFTCEINQLNIVSTKLKSLKYTVESADFNFIPTTTVELSDEDIEKMGKLIDKLEEHPDVVCLYDNAT